MIDIYTEKKDSKDWIIQNDLFFNLHTGNEEMSEKDKKMIKQIDGAILTSDIRRLNCSIINRTISWNR